MDRIHFISGHKLDCYVKVNDKGGITGAMLPATDDCNGGNVLINFSNIEWIWFDFDGTAQEKIDADADREKELKEYDNVLILGDKNGKD